MTTNHPHSHTFSRRQLSRDKFSEWEECCSSDWNHYLKLEAAFHTHKRIEWRMRKVLLAICEWAEPKSHSIELFAAVVAQLIRSQQQTLLHWLFTYSDMCSLTSNGRLNLIFLILFHFWTTTTLFRESFVGFLHSFKSFFRLLRFFLILLKTSSRKRAE